jgi:hypothetical protein
MKSLWDLINATLDEKPVDANWCDLCRDYCCGGLSHPGDDLLGILYQEQDKKQKSDVKR